MHATHALCRWVLPVVVVLTCSRAAQAATGRIDVPVCAQAPTLDANLDDPAWQGATRLTGFYRVAVPEVREATIQTTAWVCRDDTFLYMAVRCHEPTALSVRRNVFDRDGPVHVDDSVEIFIDPGTGGARYAQLMLSVTGAQADQLKVGKESRREWNLHWRAAARLDPHIDTATGWSAEVAIPLAPLQDMAGDQAWRMNLCRTRRAATPVEHTSLAELPPRTGFNAPMHFLPVRGLDDFQAKRAFGPSIAGVDLSPLKPADAGDGYAYGVTVHVKNLGGARGAVEIAVVDRPQGGAEQAVSEQVRLEPMQVRQIAFDVPVDALGPREATVLLRLPESQAMLARAPVHGMDRINPFEAYLERNYYATEAQARVCIELHLDPAAARQENLVAEARLLDEDGAPVAEVASPVTERAMRVALPIDEVGPGEHPVHVLLHAGDAQAPLGTARLTLHRVAAPPQTTSLLQIDRWRRALLLDGEPWFPVGAFGMFHHGRFEGYRVERYAAQYAYAEQAGMNAMIDWIGYGGGRTLEDIKNDYDLLHEHGIKVWGRPWSTKSEYGSASYADPDFRETAGKIIAAMDPYLEMARQHPAVIGYYHFDEPQPHLDIDDVLVSFRDKVRSVDPYHPVYMSLTRVIHHPAWFGKATDLMGAHNYWYVKRPETLVHNAGYFELIDRHSRRARVPSMDAGQLDYWGTGYRSGYFMQPREMWVQAWFMLVHGAKSMMYFVMPLRHELSVETHGEIHAAVQRMAPALLARDPVVETTYAPEQAVLSSPSPEVTLPMVQTALHEHPDGGYLLLAVNRSYKTALRARYALSGLHAGSQVSRTLGDAETLPVADGAFRDELEPWGVRAYRITGVTAPGPGPIRLDVRMEAPSAEPAAEAADEERPEAENLLADKNPGFEAEGGWTTNQFAQGKWGEHELVSDDPHAGEQCLKMPKAVAGTPGQVLSEPVRLAPETTYRFGGRVRFELTEATRAPYFLLYAAHAREGKIRVSSQARAALDEPGEWQKVEGTYTTPAAPAEDVRLWLRLDNSFVGTAWFDDVFIEPAQPAAPADTEPGARPGRNMVLNPSFEEHRVPGHPDLWVPYTGEYLVPSDKASGLEETNPVHGRYCYRVVKPDRMAYVNVYNEPYPAKPDTDYTLSLYMRSDKPGFRFRVYYLGKVERYELTPEWKRYVVTANSAKRTQIGWTGIAIDEGACYIDAVQLEQGDEATEFTP